MESKMENPTDNFREMKRASAHICLTSLKLKCGELELLKEKRVDFLQRLFCPKKSF